MKVILVVATQAAKAHARQHVPDDVLVVCPGDAVIGQRARAILMAVPIRTPKEENWFHLLRTRLVPGGETIYLFDTFSLTENGA